jgi:M6 family metalloprotease-like protein
MKRISVFLFLMIIPSLGFHLLSQPIIHKCPASPYPLKITQPDGTRISILGKGDEYYSYSTTIDGYTIIKNSAGIYEYAVKSDSNYLINSGKKATDPEERKNADKDFLQTISKGIVGINSLNASEQSKNKQQITGNNNMSGGKGVPSKGTIRNLMLLISYPDMTNTYSPVDLNNMMNQTGFNGTGSFKEYFSKVSINQFTVNTDVFGWFTAANNYLYYAWDNGSDVSRQLVAEAIDAAEAAGVDFSQYDNDQDGFVDALTIVHSGPGAEEGSQTQYIWSHASGLSIYARNYDGVTISSYNICPETRSWGMVGIGVLCHEFGHIIGLPDLYDTGKDSEGIGEWCLMGSGAWLGGEKTPAFMCAWARIKKGWISPTPINSGTYSLDPSVNTSVVYKILTEATNEYFLFENRQNTGQDLYLPGKGLAIWHIDDNQTSNTDQTHKWVDLEEADGLNDLDNGINRGDPGDLYPGSSNSTYFNNVSNPNSDLYSGSPSYVNVNTITEANLNITFSLSTNSSPCNDITSINGCGSSNIQTFTGGGSGVWNNNMCYFQTPGIEKIYQFTAPATGTYNIEVTSAIGYVDYGWKVSDCSETGWNCIDDINEAGTFGSMEWTAGTTYYILLDDEDAGTGTHAFYINSAELEQPGSISGSDVPCSNSTDNIYSVSNISGVTYTWNYSGSGTTITSGQGTSTITVNYSANATSGTWAVTPSNSCGTGIPGTLAVTISSIPARPGAITGNAGPCQNTTDNIYSVTNVSGVTYDWSYSGTGSSVTTGQGTHSITVSYAANATSGTWTVTPSNDCGNGTARTLAVTVSSVIGQPSAITGPVSLCTNTAGNVYSVTNVSGVTYTWSYSGSGASITAGQGTSGITVSYSSNATSGTWTVTPSNGCGNGTPRTLAVTMSSAPGQPGTISGSAALCQNTAGNIYSVTNVNGVTYNWSYSGSGASITAGQGTSSITVSYSANATSGTWTVTPNNGCGNGTPSTVLVTISSIPAQPSVITGSSGPCQNTTDNIYSVTNVSGVTYAWSYSGTGSSVTAGQGTHSITVSYSANATSGTWTVTPGNDCGNGNARTLAVTVSSAIGQPGAITGPVSLCTNTAGNVYSVTNVSGVTYNWSYSGSGASITAGQGTSGITVSYSSNATSGTWTVTPNNGCGNGPSRSLSIVLETCYTISGYVKTSDQTPISGVIVSGLPDNPITNNLGYYTASVGNGWSGIATPLLYGYTFSPSTVSYTYISSNQNTNYTATKNEIVFNLYDNINTLLHTNDTLKIDKTDPGSLYLTVESNTDWNVTENSLWFDAVKENNTSIKINYKENISLLLKTSPLQVTNALNDEIEVIIQQKARISSLKQDKFGTVKMYPNPAIDHVKFDIGEEQFDKLEIIVSNIQGSVLKTREYNNIHVNQIIELEVAELTTGQYLIQITDGNQQKSFLLIKY